MAIVTKKNVLCCLPILIILWTGCNGVKQIQLEDSLLNNSQKWEAKIKGGIFSMGKANFGPYKTKNYTKLDSAKLKKNSNSFFCIHLLRHSETIIKRKVYSIDIAQDTNTVKILAFIWFKSETDEAGLLSLTGSEDVSNLKDAEGEIVINNNKNSWRFFIESYGIDPIYRNDVYAETSGYLIHNSDTLIVSNVKHFTDKKPGYGGVISKGIVVRQKNQPIAALQLMGKNYVWIQNPLDNETKLAIAAFFAAILNSKDIM